MRIESNIRLKIQQEIKQQLFPGCVIGQIKNKKISFISEGNFTYDTTSPKVSENAIFDVASITKAIPTACLALKCIEEGKLSLQDKIITYIPELKNNYSDDILVKHLLTQTLNFGYSLSSYKNLSPKHLLKHIFHGDLREKPGKSLYYCNATSILLGIILERITRDNLENLSQNLLFKPLEMRCTTFNAIKSSLQNTVPTEIDSWRGKEIKGEIHDETAWKLRKIMIPGSAGLFSTANDLLNFADMLLNQGIYRNIRIFQAQSIDLMRSNQITNTVNCTGLGFELNQPLWMGKKCTSETFGKTGFTGCSILIDIGRRIGLVILSNCTYPQRKKDKKEINGFRRAIGEIVMGKQKFTHDKP